jgi:Regulator of chromosome condensation (RCC1) repeat
MRPATPATVSRSALAPRGSISAGEQHACAVTAANRVACWGKAGSGRLGVPRGGDQLTPVVVPGVEDAVGVAVAETISCAWTSHGTVWCWGDEEAYEHGAHQVPGLTDIVQIVAGARTACGLHRGGNVACWTSDHWADPLFPPVRDLPNLDHAIELAGDGANLCARVEGGDVVCLVRAPKHDDMPMGRRTKRIIDEAHGAISLSGAAERFIALVPGKLVTWESAVLEGRRYPAPEVPIQMIDGIAGERVVVGGGRRVHACVLGEHSRCWRIDGLVDNPRSPGEALPVVGASDVAIGDDVSCARTGDHVECWGLRGLLGDGATELPPDPVAVKGITDAVQLEVYFETSCVLRANGRIACWGKHQGAWGPGGKPVVDLEPVELPGVTDVVELAMSFDNVCAGTRSGTRCWKSDDRGRWTLRTPAELANATRLFTEIDLCGADASGAVHCLSNAASTIQPALRASLAIGSRCAQGPHGDPACWHGPGAIVEATSFGQRCNVRTGGGVECRHDDGAPFVANPELARVVSYDGMYGLTAGGTVVHSMWGGPIATPPAIAKMRDIVELRAGSSFVCGRTRDGRVTCWGDREMLGAGLSDTSGAVRVKDLVLAASPLPTQLTAPPPPAAIAPVAKVQPIAGTPMLGPFATRDQLCAIERCSGKQELDCPDTDDIAMDGPPAPFAQVALVPINCREPRGRDGSLTYRLVVRRDDGYYASAPLVTVGGNDKYCGGDLVPAWHARDFGVSLSALARTRCRGGPGAHDATATAFIAGVADVPRGKPVVFPSIPIAVSTDYSCESPDGCTESHHLVKLDAGWTGDVLTLVGPATWRGPRQTKRGFDALADKPSPTPVGSYRFTKP